MIYFGNLPNATFKEVPSGITNIDLVVKLSGIATNEHSCLVLPIVNNNNLSASTSVYFNRTINTVTIQSGVDRSSLTAYVIIEYTKTTD